ncbi:glycosyltransferase family 4 protein [Amphibacillus jilinensis]|uniref:glycosyltransferase family 4 protein n=1 Tax=Amphibacillus jilinensis TaxID=1216008 RepID=UPI00031EF1F2|nr:glycosyltransferase family 4 protein [Amphibacillus jilinensis]
MKKKLAIVAHNINNKGGMEKHLLEMIKRLKYDYAITVIATELDCDCEDVKFMRIPISQRPVFLKSILFMIIVSVILTFKKFDLVHTTGAIVLNRVDVSTVHFCHKAYHQLGLHDRVKVVKSNAHRLNTWFQNHFARIMENLCYQPKRIPQLVAVSEHVKEELTRYFNYDNQNVSIIYNGVDTEVFKPVNETRKKIYKRKRGMPEDALVFIFVGGDWTRKGLPIMIEVFAHLRSTYPTINAKLLVVGKGDEKRLLSGLDSNMRNHVIFYGFQENPTELYNTADIYVLPSLYETFSIASLEAAACGLPIIMTEVGISSILAENGVTGFTVERNKHSLQAACETLSLNIQLRKEMSIKAHEKAKYLTWDRSYILFKALYKNIVN